MTAQYQIVKQINNQISYIGFVANHAEQIANLSALKNSYVAQGADVKIDETETFTIVFQKQIMKFYLSPISAE